MSKSIITVTQLITSFFAPPMLQNTFKEFSDSFSAGKETMVYQLQLTQILLMIFNSAGKSLLLGSLYKSQYNYI